MIATARRTAALLILAALVAPAAYGTSTPSPTYARTAPAATCIGAWRLDVADEPGAPPLHALLTVDADGTMVYGETSAITSLTQGVPVEYTSPGVGAWSATAAGCRYTIVVLAANAHGKYVRTSTITGRVILSGPDRFAGPVHILVTHPDHTHFTINTGAIGTRIRA